MSVDPVEYARLKQRAELRYRATVKGDQGARQQLAQLDLDRAAPPAAPAEPTQPAAVIEPDDDVTTRRKRTAEMFGLNSEHLVFLTAEDTDDLFAQAELVAQKFGTRPPAEPTFVPTPGQAAGNGTPPGPARGTREWGEQQYREYQNRTSNRWSNG